MAQQTPSLLPYLLAGLLLVALWVASIIYVYLDTDRRMLRRGTQLFWLVISAILPIVGGLLYLFFRRFLHSRHPGGGTEPYPGMYPTPLRRPQDFDNQLPTLPATDLAEDTLAAAPEQTRPKENRKAGDGRRYTLEILEGPQTGQQFGIIQLPARIGRGSGAGIQLNEDLGVSRQHAEIYERNGQLRIRDLQSTHGTFVNGFGILDNILKPGDEIRIGATTLVLHVGGVRGR